MPNLTEEELKEAKAVRSKVAEILDEDESEKKESKKANDDMDEKKIREEGEREGKKAALKSLLNAMSDDDEREKLHDKVDASDDEDMKKDMNEMHSRKGKKAAATAMDPDDYLKKTKHMTDAAIIADAAVQARLKRFEDKEKKVMVDDLVALKASIVPNVDEEKYHKLLMERSFSEIEGWHAGRQDEIEAIKARRIMQTPANRGAQHPTFAFNARATAPSNGSLSSLDAVFEGGSK